MQKKTQFQSIILALQHFWADKGCLIWQPYYTQVGAGTMNPATFLRVLGPEPWNVGYVEPSIRPDDGRYGDNPYRLQQHYQFQVILKPDPGNPQELYLQSLEAIGIDPHLHDIRFVEDNWESPALGAWGLGWEVWLDGQEITQFTYFQQAGGFNLEPVSVEITYGLERIAMALQGNYNFRDIQWTSDFTYGDVNLQGEQEHSRYYFETADITRLREMFDLFEKEANLALGQGLVLPAHDYILKCSHTFNILDTRGAVGVTERQALFGRMRDLSHQTADAYIAQREALGFPWLGKQGLMAENPLESEDASQMALPETPASDSPADLLVEIGCEELPVNDLGGALDQLRESLPALLDDLRLAHAGFRVMGTPRRLVMFVQELAPRQADIIRLVKGPPADKAFDAQGKLTPAALGFARSKGIDPGKLQSKEMDGGTYLAAELHEQGQSVLNVLPEHISSLIGSLRFDKSMRWNPSGAAFSRPVRWLLGLYGGQVLPYRFAGLASGRETRLLRFSENERVAVKHPADYLSVMEANGIILAEEDRRSAIESQVKALLATAKAAGQVDEGLLDEVTHLVEAPTALMGNFDKGHLALPAEVLSGVMMKHQRYFPVSKEDGQLMAHFITVRNGGSQGLETVAHGNEEVIQARFADAAFFIKEDSASKLADFLPRLETLVFQPKLGSMLDKTRRITRLAAILAERMQFDKPDADAALRAAELCKADLVTSMVVEMTSLQGIMGKYYALRSGEAEAVAEAIREHYLPRYAGDRLPETKPGIAVGMADRLDSLAGLFSVGMAPTGAKDPFGLRRAAIGLMLILTRKGIDLDLTDLIASAGSLLPVTPTPADLQACLDFITGRLENQLLEDGFRHDVVKAVLAEQGGNPAKALAGVKALSDWVGREDWRQILPAFARCVRITRDQQEIFPVNAQHLSMPEEKALYHEIRQAEKTLGNDRTIPGFLDQIAKMVPVINAFFDAVLVMDENLQIRQNRLGMLQELAVMADGLADFSRLEGF